MRLSKIQLRALLPTTLLLTISVLLAFYALKDYQVESQRLTSQGRERAQQTLGLLKQEIEYRAIDQEPIRNAQRLLASKNIAGAVETLALISSSGQVLAKRFVDKDLQTQTLRPYFTHAVEEQLGVHLAGDDQMIHAYTLLKLNAPAGAGQKEEGALLYASYNLNTAKAALWQQIRSDFQVVWLAIFIVIIVLAFLLERLITRPLAKLVDFSQRLSNDYSGLQHNHLYLGEIAALQQALNTMSSKVAHTVSDLNTQQENLEVTLHSIGDAVITTDAQGLVTRMNPIAEQLTGWYAYEARGQSLASIFPIIDADSRTPADNPIDKVLSSGKTVYLSQHTTLVARDGSEYQIADSAAPIRDINDDIIGMILVFNDVTEEYQLRQTARNIQDQISGLFNDMQAMAAIMEPDGSIIFINNTPLKLSGINLADIADKKLWECPWFTHSAELQAAIAIDCMRAAAGEVVSHDIEAGSSKGLFFWAQFSVHPVFNEDGQVIQLLAEGHDISLRKRAEKELNASLQQIQLYQQQTPLATVEWSSDLKIQGWNEAASQLFGYSHEEAIGADASLLLRNTTPDEMTHVKDSILRHGCSKIMTSHNVTKQGRSVFCEWHNSAIVDLSGEVIGIASLALDITAEHEAKSALIKSEQELREILASLVEGVITADENGKVLSINPAAEKIFGYSNEDISGKDLSLIMPNFDIDNVDLYLGHKTETAVVELLDGLQEVTGLRKNKMTFPMQITAAELAPTNDGTRRFIGSCHDLTQTKLQQEHLQRTQKMDALGKIVGGIAHDYNNMLGVILGYADLMAIKYQHIDGLHHYINQISQAGERGRDLTQRMLAFSKQESSHAEAIELHTALNTQNELLAKSITALIKLDYQLCESRWTIWVDPSELEDTLLNLAINAKHAMPDGGALTLKTQQRQLDFAEARAMGLAEGDYMELQVTDTGPGISEDIQSKIFDPFFTTKGSGGTGLGLSQAYGFMDRCGGTIRVTSRPGAGTQFSLYFPRYEGEVAQRESPAEKALPSPANNEKILIVDDEPALRDLTQEILSIAGYQVLIASDADTALTILARESVDLMISDIIMPTMNGYDLANIVNQKYPHIKIQLASGYSSEQTIADIHAQWHSHILRKPFRSSELLGTVAGLLEPSSDVH